MAVEARLGKLAAVLQRRPSHPALRPLVRTLWASEQAPPPQAGGVRLEHSLPTGAMHLVFRLEGPPVRLLDAGGPHELGYSLIGGARSSFHVKDVSAPSVSVGAQLLPGAAQALFGVSAQAFAGRHTRLEDVWGPGAEDARAQLLEAVGHARRLSVLEALLAARLQHLHSLHPAMAHALQGIRAGRAVGEVTARSGYSHRHFVSVFRGAVGLSPKEYSRVLRFQQVLKLARSAQTWALVDIAAAAGFSDQAHFSREFRAFSGCTPQAYRRLQPEFAHHVLLPPAAP